MKIKTIWRSNPQLNTLPELLWSKSKRWRITTSEAVSWTKESDADNLFVTVGSPCPDGWSKRLTLLAFTKEHGGK
jgi:hypothetical protein